ncbi:MAG: NAD(P)H-hydrate dehydratase, partial [Deltaproteobacteria bacterium]|nr:NAD(P)H-hydrate dehydratase [Deltaproteobacteria bacterium]
MKLVTAKQMQGVDREAIHTYKIPSLELMENAGRGTVEAILDSYGDLQGRKIAVFVGPGNNGGDGLVIARLLAARMACPVVFLLVPAASLKGDSAVNLSRLHEFPVKIIEVNDNEDLLQIPTMLENSWAVVDAIFGTGLTRVVSEIFEAVIKIINRSICPVIAVDIPSGLNSDSGIPLGVCVQADITVTFGLAKIGQVIHPGRDCIGFLKIVDIGIPEKVLAEADIRLELLTKKVGYWLPPRTPLAHKGTYGHLFVLAGSPGRTGAACLCSESALRCGAGLVTLGIPKTLNAVMEQKLTEVMTLPLPGGEDETLSSGGLEEIKQFASSVKGLAVGPGMGVNNEIGRIVRALWVDVDRPMVWDADALTLLARNPELRGKQSAEIVVTPHPGEMGRLIDKPVGWVQENRVEAARSFAEQWGVITVLKGARTLTAAPDGRLRINPTGNPGMAAGGMGDVLTGMIGAFLVQGFEAYDAASLAVWLHGAAGDRAAQNVGPIGFLASEVMQSLPHLFREIMEE